MRLVRVIQRPTDAELTAEEMMDAIDGYARELTRGAGACRWRNVRGVGTAFPSHVDFAAGVLLETADLYQLNDTPVRDMLEERMGLRCSSITTPTPRRWPSTGWARGAASAT